MASEKKITAENRQEVSGSQLTDDIGIDSEEIRWRKDFTGFDGGDRQCLDGLSGVLEDIADDLVDDFYDHLEEYDETREIFGDSTKSVDQLKETQRQYLLDLGTGTYDQQYFESRARIGKIHDMLDLGPKIYLGAYSVYYRGIIEAIADDVKERLVSTDGGAAVRTERSSTEDGALSPEEAIDEVVEQSLSALKLLNLDQQVAMDTYIHSYSQNLETELDRQARVASEVERAVGECQTTADDVAESTEEISGLAREQADAMGDVADEVSTMSATVEEIAATADEVATTSERAEELAEEGQSAATEAIDVMEQVNDSSTAVADDVSTL